MKLKQRVIRDIIYYSAKLELKFLNLFPYKFCVKLGGFLAKFFGRLASDRAIVIANLKIAFPDKAEQAINKLADAVFEHLGKTLFEFLSFPKLTKNDILGMVEAEGLEYIDNALKDGKGIILLSAHIGNWELLGAYLALRGYPINVVAKRIYDDRLNDILVQIRQSKGVNCLLRTESTKDMIKVLKKNECLGMLIDQDTNVKGCFVNFFGKKAYTPTGATILALKYNTVVLPVCDMRINDTKHKILIKPPLDIKRSGDIEKDIIENTQNFNLIIEDMIKKYPRQWVWVHKRWKTQEN